MAENVEYRIIVKHLDHPEYLGQLSAYFKKTLIDMLNENIRNLRKSRGLSQKELAIRNRRTHYRREPGV